jgi:cytochrome P450
MSDIEIAYANGSLFGAGVETSSGTLLCFLLACAQFGHELVSTVDYLVHCSLTSVSVSPRFIAEAQRELDRVVGSDRLPSYDDQPDLPYIQAVVAETLRWRPVAVLGGTPHASTEDIDFNGFFIPKGTTIISPLWTIHLNEADFPDAHHFKPER